jgi:uncharacterized protein
MKNMLLAGVNTEKLATNNIASDFHPPRWLGGAGMLGGNLQTIWPALYSRRYHGPHPQYRRERWTTPDDDFIDVDYLVERENASTKLGSDSNIAPPPSNTKNANAIFGSDPNSGQKPNPTNPLLVLFHGLEGSSRSHYAEAFADFCTTHQLAYAVPHFRGCSGELNTAPRAYHSGDWQEIDWILRKFKQEHQGPVIAVGVSLGGNALMRWAGELEGAAAQVVQAVASVSSPLDMAAGGWAIGRGFNRLVYTRMFLSTMVPNALRKLQQHPGLFDGDKLKAASTLYEFDNLFTAPLHGFKDVNDYWLRASAKPHMQRIRLPALALNARNDPFVPASSLPTQTQVSASVELWQPTYGGHVGFPTGAFPAHVRAMPEAVGQWLLARA